MITHLKDETLGDAVLLGDFENGSPEWHELRSQPGAIGGSQVGAICGFSAWESPLARYYKATGQIDDHVQPSMSMRLGTLLESPILQIFAEEHPELDVYTVGTYANKDKPYLHANMDGVYRHRESGLWGVVEVKFSRDYWSEPPMAYRAQLFHYLNVTGFGQGFIVALAGSSYMEFFIERDDFEAAFIADKVEDFHRRVLELRPPEFDGASSTLEAQRKINPEIDGSEVEIAELLGIGLVNTATRIDELTAELNELKARTLDQMGKAKTAFIDVDGEKFVVAKRQQRGAGSPFIQVEKGAKK
jgi:predicted phage-related endonuclease